VNGDFGETLHHIDTRVTIIESELESLASTHKWIRGIALVLVIQVVLAAMGFAKLAEQVDSLNLKALETNIATALQVLADHGTELEGIRREDARMRGALDAIRAEISVRTSDRFTGRDADRLYKRLLRLEDTVYTQE
jgi:Tfp pilus assembly protein PilO